MSLLYNVYDVISIYGSQNLNFCPKQQFSKDKKSSPILWNEPMMSYINSIHIFYLKVILCNSFTQFNTVFERSDDF